MGIVVVGDALTIPGVISNDDSAGGPASLTCNAVGSGTITGNVILSGQNTYTADTFVTGGTLILYPQSLIGAGSLSVNENTTLGLNVTAGGHSECLLSDAGRGGTANGIVTLNITNGTLSGNPTLPAIKSTNVLSAAGTNIAIVLQGSGYQPGQFPLISYAGTPLNSLSNFHVCGHAFSSWPHSHACE